MRTRRFCSFRHDHRPIRVMRALNSLLVEVRQWPLAWNSKCVTSVSATPVAALLRSGSALTAEPPRGPLEHMPPRSLPSSSRRRGTASRWTSWRCRRFHDPARKIVLGVAALLAIDAVQTEDAHLDIALRALPRGRRRCRGQSFAGCSERANGRELRAERIFSTLSADEGRKGRARTPFVRAGAQESLDFLADLARLDVAREDVMGARKTMTRTSASVISAAACRRLPRRGSRRDLGPRARAAWDSGCGGVLFAVAGRRAAG